MPSGQRDGIVQEEEWGPSAGLVERMAPTSELGEANDPQRSVVVPLERSRVVEEASPVSGEHAALSGRMQVTPWVDPILPRHANVLSQLLKGCGAMAVPPKTVLVTFVGAHVVNDFYATVLPAFLPSVAEEFDLDYAELGILSFAFVLLTGVMQPVLGSFADRNGKRRFITVFGFAVAAVGFLAMAIAPSFWFIVLVSLLCGLGAASYHPQATAFIVAAYPEKRGRMLGIHGWGGSAGHFLAPGVVVLAVWALNWRVTMAIIAIPMLITAVIVRSRLDETTPSKDSTLRGAVTKQLLLVAVTFGLVAMVGRTFLTFFVQMLVDEGWNETTAGVLLSIILVGGTLAQTVGGLAHDRIGGRNVVTIAASAISLFVVMFAFTSGAAALIAIAGIAFFQFSLYPVGLALASQYVSGQQTGTATGVVFGISGLMTAVEAPAVGWLAEQLDDIRAALAWQLPIIVLAIVFSLRMKPPQEAPAQGTPVDAVTS